MQLLLRCSCERAQHGCPYPIRTVVRNNGIGGPTLDKEIDESTLVRGMTGAQFAAPVRASVPMRIWVFEPQDRSKALL